MLAVCPPFAIWDEEECVCPSNKYWTGEACCPPSSSWADELSNCVCNGNRVWDGSECTCAIGTVWNGDACCPPFADWDGTQCVCPVGKYYTGTACCEFDSVWVGSVTTGNCKYVAPGPPIHQKLFVPSMSQSLKKASSEFVAGEITCICRSVHMDLHVANIDLAFDPHRCTMCAQINGGNSQRVWD